MPLEYGAFMASHNLNTDFPVGEVLMDDRPVILRGYDGILHCRFRGEPLAVYWEKGPDLASATKLVSWHPPTGGIRVQSYGIGKYNLTEDFSLVIHDVEDNDAGRYICIVSDFRGYELSNHTVATVKVPPQEPFPTIDQCPSGSTGSKANSCTLTTEIGDDTTALTCRARGAPRGVVSLSWTLSNGTLSQQGLQRSANPDGETENLMLTIDATPSDDSYVCTAILPVTTHGDATISVIVNLPSTRNATDPFTGDPGSRSLGKVGIAIIVAILLLITLIIISIIIVFIWRRRIKKSYEPLNGDMKFIKGPVSYLELWELVGKCNPVARENIVNRLVNKTQTDSGFDVVRSNMSKAEFYYELCRWKETTTGDHSILSRAIKKVWLNAEIHMQDVRDRTSKEISLDDLKHICWHVHGCRERVKPILRALYPRHEGIPNCKGDSCDHGKPRNAEIKNDLQLMKAWKEHSMTTKPGYQEPEEDHNEGERVQMRQPTSRGICCCHKQPKYRHGDDKNEQQPMFSAQSEEVELGVERSSPNQMIQLCLALERAGKDAHGPDKGVYIQLAKTFFRIEDEYKRELDNEVIKEFALSITKQHYQNLAKAKRISADSIAKRNAEDLKAVFKTDVMLEEWVQEQKCSNYEVRCRLRQAAEQCNRQDIADIFITREQSEFLIPITTHQASVTITNERRQGVSESRQVTGISQDELERICRYGGREALSTYWHERYGDRKHKNLDFTILSDHEIICMLKPVIDSQHHDIVIQQRDTRGNTILFMKQLLQDRQSPRYILRQNLQNEAPHYACLIAKVREDKIFDVELVELAHRLVLSDVYPIAKSLNISDAELTCNRHELGPNVLREGTGKLLLEMNHTGTHAMGIEERLVMVNALKVAGYLEEARSIVFGFEISLADEAEIEEKRVDPAKLAKELGVSDDSKPVGPDGREESCQSVLQRWRNIVRHSSFNHRMVLADAMYSLGEKELALGIISGKFRNNVINSQVSKMLAKTIPEGVQDTLTRGLGKKLETDLNPHDIITAWVAEKKFFGFLQKSPITLSNDLLKEGFYPFAHEIMAGGWKGKDAIIRVESPAEEAGDENYDASMSCDLEDQGDEQNETNDNGIKENSQPSLSYSETLDLFGGPDDDRIAFQARAMVHF
ncbi:uncharacterized protein LOC121419542 [Lytechinus variegatus]|uniref:uncharacterized protein LOC121419542 n=1 Tax=Lytechinus variegatus TaxID=7654 RepID=UPI001BB18B65|nr:uncharacterized protein LOC121419542 [Lytechinus variegatus]